MALKSLQSTWEEYKGWFFLLFSGYVLWSFRGVFSAVGGAAGSGAGALLGGVQQGAQDKADKAKAKAATGGKTDFTDEQMATFRADAASMATYLGRGSGVGLQNVFKDQQSAFSLIKNSYSRLSLFNNKPFKMGYSMTNAMRKLVPITQTAETSESVKNKINYKVLSSFYRDVTDGHDLAADFRYYVTDAKYKAFFKWIL